MFSSIVVGTDGSATATEAVRQAVDMAKAVGAQLELVSAYAPVPKQRLREERGDAPAEIRWAIDPSREAEASLEDAADLAREAGVDVDAHARQGDPSGAILEVAEQRQADLIIVGTRA